MDGVRQLDPGWSQPPELARRAVRSTADSAAVELRLLQDRARLCAVFNAASVIAGLGAAALGAGLGAALAQALTT